MRLIGKAVRIVDASRVSAPDRQKPCVASTGRNSNEENGVGNRHNLRCRSPPGAGRRDSNRMGWHRLVIDWHGSLSTGTSTTQQITDGGLAISVSGIPLVKTGNSFALSSLGPNIAIAYNNSSAYAVGVGNIAIATNRSSAQAVGILNSVTADNNSDAHVSGGTGNTLIAQTSVGRPLKTVGTATTLEQPITGPPRQSGVGTPSLQPMAVPLTYGATTTGLWRAAEARSEASRSTTKPSRARPLRSGMSK
jgi:hypothetical protein